MARSKEGLQVKYNGQTKNVNIEVIPIKAPGAKERSFLVLFEEVITPAPFESKHARLSKARADEGKRRSENSQVAQLKKELAATKEYLQSASEEQEATNEELRSANEESQSSNEELQSTNEELETAKEELQSTNEELTTVNEELENRNLELSQVNNDLTNLLNSVHIPIVMLGSDLRIRRFTLMAEKVLNVIPTDVGRKISDIKPNVNIPDLEQLILGVIDTLSIKEREVRDQSGHWYSLQIRPYKTSDHKIEGVVLTLVDIDAQKRREEVVIQISNEFNNAIVETVREPLVVLDSDLRVKRANQAFYKTFLVSPKETVDGRIYEIGNRQWNIPKLRELLEEILPKHTQFQDFEIEHDFPTIGRRKMVLNARQIRREGQEPEMILLAIEDITNRG